MTRAQMRTVTNASARARTVVWFSQAVTCIAFLVCSVSCSQRIGDFTGISTKNIYAKGVDVSSLPRAEGVKGECIKFLGIGATIEDALDDALAKGNGNLMIDCALYRWEAPFFGGFTVRGSVISVPYGEPETASEE